MSKRRISYTAIFVVLVAIQLVPVDRTNPTSTESLPFPQEVSKILRGSCFDCHSNETKWPWYSYVAPASWMIAHHVDEGREELNFSKWSEMREEKRPELKHQIWEEIAEHKMPLRGYLYLHSDAKLSSAEMETLRTWSR